MPGAIVGDIVGSVYEFDNHRSKDFPLFREDSKFTDDRRLRPFRPWPITQTDRLNTVTAARTMRRCDC